MLRITIFLVLFVQAAIAQNYKAVKVLGPEVFYLNSITNMTSMKPRVVKTFLLPPNTVRWYYSFSAVRKKEDVMRVQNQFSLLSKISYAMDQTGVSAGLINLVGAPPGSDYCDVFLLPNQNHARLFESNQQFSVNPQGSRENLASGTIEVTSVNSGWQYIGFRNNDYTNGINVNVEIVAIVKEAITTNGWTKEQKELLFKNFKKEFRKNGADKYLNSGEIDAAVICILKKFITQYSPEQAQSYAEYELKEIILTMAKECDNELGLKLDERVK